MKLRIMLVGSFAIAALAACGDDSGGSGSSGSGGSGSTTGATGTGTTTGTGTPASTGTDTGSTGTDTGSTGTDTGSTGTDTGSTGTSTGVGGGTAFDCDSYCQDVATACEGANQQHIDGTACNAACEAFDVGEFQDDGNTLGCRAYHAQAALDAPDIHCIHAGPLGTGACSADATSPCEAFCQIADSVCPGQYASVAACEKVCAGFAEGDYSAGEPDDAGDTLACRMYHLSVASTSDDNNTLHCPHIAGVSDTCNQ